MPGWRAVGYAALVLIVGVAGAEPRFGLAEPKPKAEGTIRLATYNVENLFDDVDDPTLTGRQEDSTMTKPAPELEALAETIRKLDADVIGLEEIESEDALTWFMDGYMKDSPYKYVVSIDAGDERGIENSVLSKFPIVETKSWPHLPLGGVHPDTWGSGRNFQAGEPLLFHRSPLMVTVEVPGTDGADAYELTLFVVHHKSGGGGGYWREAEASKVAELVAGESKAHPGRNIAVLGDFNCVPGHEAAAVYESAGLIDALADRPIGAQGFTHASGRTLDQVWINADLVPEVVAGSGFVLGTPARPDGADWRTTPPPAGYASDHYPVAVDLVPADR